MSKEELEFLLRQIGVEIAGTHSDPLRWSVSDLATDLSSLMERRKDMGSRADNYKNLEAPHIRGA